MEKVPFYDFETGKVTHIPVVELTPGCTLTTIEGVKNRVWIDAQTGTHKDRWWLDAFDGVRADAVKELYDSFGESAHVLTRRGWEDQIRQEKNPDAKIAAWLTGARVFDRYQRDTPSPQGLFQVIRECTSTPKDIGHVTGLKSPVSPKLVQEVCNEFLRSYEATKEHYFTRLNRERSLGAGLTRPTTDQAIHAYIGIVDCHGIESFRRPDASSDPAYFLFRAALNQQRRAVAYWAVFRPDDASKVAGLIRDGSFLEATKVFRQHALTIHLGGPEGNIESFWQSIPNPSLDPSSKDELMTAIQQSNKIMKPTLARDFDGLIWPVDGFRRLEVCEELGIDNIESNILNLDERNDWGKFTFRVI